LVETGDVKRCQNDDQESDAGRRRDQIPDSLPDA
jgi:hypothetical protein